MSKPERHLARCRGFDFEIEDHGCPSLSGYFEYEDSGAQGWGYAVDAAFLMRFLTAVGVTSLRALEGKSCWVTHTDDKILKVEPLHAKDGEPFVVADWQEWVRKRVDVSPYEMRTGRKP